MRIFGIDDEEASLYFLSKALKEACPNDEVLLFSNHEEFLKEFIEASPDVVFLDVEMPEINGIELAKKIKEIKSDINIIYVTAYKEYALDAFSLNASAYIVKPVSSKSILEAFDNLRYQVNKAKDIVIKTFGNFDVFYKGVPIKFRSDKSKEALAYLVDRQGGLVSKKELGAMLYEDDYSLSIQSTISRNIKYLEEDLESVGICCFLIISNGAYSVDLKQADCDLLDFLEGKNDLYAGEYMEQYSWGELRKDNLDNKF